MVCLGFKSGTEKWKVLTKPLSYGWTHYYNTFCWYYFKLLESFLIQAGHLSR